MAKRPTNPGGPKPRRSTGLGRRRSDKPAVNRPEAPAPSAEEVQELAASPPAGAVPVAGTAAKDQPPATALSTAAAGAIVATADAGVLVPTREEIARRAYEIFAGRGSAHGYDVEDWLQAERELRAGPGNRTRAL